VGVAPVVASAVVAVKLVGDRLAALAKSLRKGGHLADLLDGEREPGTQLVIEVGVRLRQLDGEGINEFRQAIPAVYGYCEGDLRLSESKLSIEEAPDGETPGGSGKASRS